MFTAAGNVPQPSTDLAGRDYTLNLEDGCTARCHFLTGDRLTWELETRPGRRPDEPESYLAVKIRSGIYLVDFVRGAERATTISLLLDLDRRILTALIARLPEKKEALRPLAERATAGRELTAVSATFSSGAIGAPFTSETPKHLATRDMIGRRVEYTYSPAECYEHIYLNEEFYTWQCLRGAEKGFADTDRCHYLKLADELYCFVWREKIIPAIGLLAIDFAAMRSAGKIFGYSGTDFGATVNFPVGARARLVNVTQREQE
jgi:hypothetical protein